MTSTSLVGSLAAAGFAAALAVLPAARLEAQLAKAGPGLLVLGNRDFSLEEYRALRAAFEGHGREVHVAAGTLDLCIPWGGSLADAVRPDVALTTVDPSRYSAVVFVGGWGASSYQYAFEGTYTNAAYRKDRLVVESVNRLIGDFLARRKPVAASGHGVTVLAYARVDGISPLKSRTVSAWAGGGPAFSLRGREYADATVGTRWHVERNGAFMPLSSAIGDPATATDDVWVDGKIITAESFDSVDAMGRLLVGSDGGVW
jgi:putative intracellular protease/amidase